jgi:hypothetical protein
MRRDLALCLAIMEFAESKSDDGLATVNLEGVERGVVSAHVQMLRDAGLIEAERSNPGIGSTCWQVRRLTWAGHDWLDEHRPKQAAPKTKRFVAVKPEPDPEPELPPPYKAAGVRRVSSRSGAGAWEQPS